MHIDFPIRRTVQTKQLKPWQGVLFGLIFAIVGFSILNYGISSLKLYNEKNKTFVETTSKVIDYKYNDEGLQAIVVEYVVDGQSYQKASGTYSSIPKSLGTEVSVKYNPNDPRDAIWTTDSSNFIFPVFGGVFILAGVFIVITSIKNGKTQVMIREQSNVLYGINDSQAQVNNYNQQNLSNDINNQNNNINM